jgi:hypothetical protein
MAAKVWGHDVVMQERILRSGSPDLLFTLFTWNMVQKRRGGSQGQSTQPLCETRLLNNNTSGTNTDFAKQAVVPSKREASLQL